MEESLSVLAEVRAKVSSIASSPAAGLTEEESIFLSNVRHSIPDVLEFTRVLFHKAAAEVRRSS